MVSVASAHGNVSGPASRNYGCWERWGSNHMAPQMATEDPMCYQAWRANPNTMWNWNGLFRENVGGNHQAAIPDGQLCSGGRTDGGRYNSLDAVGNWRATPVNNNFTVNLYDQASHGADYIRVYVTKQGFNPLTQPLTWGSLDLQPAGQVGDTPASEWNRVSTGGVSLGVNVSAPGRTGRHIVYTIWQASHLDQSYYFCSDVTFPGGSGGSTPTPVVTTPAPTSPTPTVTTPAPTSPSQTPITQTPPVTPSATGDPGEAGGCSVTYAVSSQWPGAFQANVTVKAGSTSIRGWTVAWTYANGQQVQQSWGATLNRSGSTVTASNVQYNGALGAGASTSFGLIGSWTGTNDVPVPTCTATA